MAPRAGGATATLLGRWQGVAVVAGLTLLYALVNWSWLRANVVTYGWDRMDHLISTLAYNDILGRVTLRSLFEAFAWSDYYPPLVHLIAVAAYKLFGVDEDVAVMTNLIYLALLLAATWSIARRAGGAGVALLATLVVATFPMIYAMSRYLYLDFALTGLVAASVAALLAGERFTRRGPSLLFGLALGAAFLVKWTTAAFLAVPLALILWRSGAVAAVARDPALLRPNPLRLALALFGGMVLAGLAIWPARDVAARQPLGLALIPLLGLLAGGVVYALLGSAGAGRARAGSGAAPANVLSAAAIAALTLSLWYLPNINFLQAFYVNAYGKPSGRMWAYDRYLNYLATEQLSPLYAAIFALVAAGLLWAWWRRDGPRALNTLDDTMAVLLAWALVPFLIFASYVSTAHSRYLMPFLPPFAVWIALGLWRLRPRTLRAAIAGLVMVLAWGQFAIISFDRLDGWRDRFVVHLPGGPLNLLAHGFSIQYPATGVTDPRFAIAPDILAILEEKRQAQGRERVTLGLVVNTYQLHEKHFLYQIYIRFPRVFMRELARNWTGRPAYPQLFEMDYVLLDDTHTYRTAEESQRVTERILTHPDDLFHRAFREVRRWELPGGDTIILYERRFGETQPGIAPEDYHALVQTLGPDLGPGDALILTAPDQVYIVGLLLPEESPVAVVPLPADGASPEAATATLEEMAGRYRRLFLVSHNSAVVDPDSRIEGWLRAHALPGPESWIGTLRVAAFVPGAPSGAPALSLDARFEGAAATLAGATIGVGEEQAAGGELDGGPELKVSARPGDPLPVTLFWKASASVDGLKVFVHLIGPDGTLLAQRDTLLTDGPQAHALLIPRSAAPGVYHLTAGLYRATDGARLPAIVGGRPVPENRVPLADVVVGEAG